MQWSLEDIYNRQVRGNIPRRKHLRVLGEAAEEQTESDIANLKAEIKQAVDNLSLDDTREAQKLLNQIYNFPTYKNVKKTLGDKGYSNLIFKRFSADIQRLIEDVPPGSRDQFLAYLQTPEESLVFPTELREGSISRLIENKLDPALIDYIMRHTGQDEGGRGVGMGELALALIFKNLGAGGQKKKANVAASKEALQVAKDEFKANVGNKGFGEAAIKQRIKDSDLDASKYDNQYVYNLDKVYNDFIASRGEKVKGDLELGGEEFEIKGEGATLGARPDDISDKHKNDTANSLGKMKIKEKGNGYLVGGQEISGLNNLPVAISTAYILSEDRDKFEDIFINFLKVSGELGATDRYYNELNFDLSNPASIQNGIGLLNFIDYAEKEQFKHFMTHDVGAKGVGSGQYVYVSGTPIQMAKDLLASSAKFEKVSRSNLRPRIGFGGNYAGMLPTAVNVDSEQEISEVEEEEIEYY